MERVYLLVDAERWPMGAFTSAKRAMAAMPDVRWTGTGENDVIHRGVDDSGWKYAIEKLTLNPEEVEN